MKFIGHRFVFAAAAFLALAGKGDAVGVMSIDAGTNGIVEAEMPFDAVDGNGPASFTNIRGSAPMVFCIMSYKKISNGTIEFLQEVLLDGSNAGQDDSLRCCEDK